MEIMKFSLGNLKSNCYILSEADKAIIIDPGYESDDVIRYVKKLNLSVEAIYLTHGHFDHVGGVKQLKDLFTCVVYAPIKDKIWMGKSSYNQLGYEIPVDIWVKDLDTFEAIGLTFTVFETPGHSEGSTVLSVDHILFSGDTLFYQSIGRTDIPLSDPQAIYRSVKRIYQLFEEDIMVYPGHGRTTDIGHEKKFNPFVRG
ncbi:MAG: MBL fold metallo-hydrolase [Acholeplasma sp.]|jgi:glyoxylase-like metal-dependent hydrolase (beta-lactamase superfamily II)|nr:MAG: MBL fold metallo-hydrolase [Acholeplasma sp.]